MENERRAVTVTCRRADGRQYEVAASEVVIPPNLPGADTCILDRILWLNPSD